MADFALKAGDTAPPFVGRCLDAKGQPVPTTGATVRFRMTPQVAGLRAVIDQPAAWSSPATAEATYVWVAGDTAVPGLYHVEFVVTYAGGKVESFPNGAYATIEILPAG